MRNTYAIFGYEKNQPRDSSADNSKKGKTTMASTITKLNSTTFNDVTFSALSVNKNRGKTVYINVPNLTRGNNIKLPSLTAPYGLSTYVDEKSGTVSYSLDLSLTPETEAIFKELDSKILDAVAENSEEWLGRKYSREILQEALYKPIVRKSKKPEYPSTIKLKIYANKDGTLTPKAFDMKKNQIKLENLRKRQDVNTLVSIPSIWFIDNKFGVSVRLIQAQFDIENDLDKCMFDGDSTSETEDFVVDE